ncbi:MAG: fructose-bisphosphate aldolase [Nitrospirales bacterium]|nr:MAG: fructose-bisphosphate aldolase [Nitrospirales bacterium]
MKLLTPQDLLPAAQYEESRAGIRQNIIALKKRRRISVGEFVTLVFENRETLLFQIQEMIRIERIFDPKKIQEECDVYNTLLPDRDELSATLFIEITDSEKIQSLLDSFKNIDQADTVGLKVGDTSIFAKFESGHSKEDKISAVHFVRFSTTPTFRDLLAQMEIPAFLTILHPQYRAEAPVSQELRHEWLKDLE